MKKIIAVILASFLTAASFSASYKNNTYQKLAREYTVKAQKALDAGEYSLAEEYAKKAEENAALSDEYIRLMMARDGAGLKLKTAQERLDFVKSIHGDVNFPIAFEAATSAMEKAKSSYDREDFVNAVKYADEVLASLEGIYEITPLPKYYVVKPWATDKDCFWNISGRPYVYNNPFLWENLYEANKNALPKKNNPNLILPGMKMEIPSIQGEYREGTYNPKADYTPFGTAKKTPVKEAVKEQAEAAAEEVKAEAEAVKYEPLPAESQSEDVTLSDEAVLESPAEEHTSSPENYVSDGSAK